MREKYQTEIEKRISDWTIAPSGDTALNYLHLSTQVPNKWSYISDGPYRKYEIAPYCIEFKHCANKEISGRSHITITVIQALKCIGKNNIQQEDVDRPFYTNSSKNGNASIYC